jgi:hypothetical protein
MGAMPVQGAANVYEVEVTGTAWVRFVWQAPFAGDLQLICRG